MSIFNYYVCLLPSPVQVSSDAVKEFSELGDSSGLDKSAPSRSVLDGFTAPPIEQGVGRTAAKIFLDGNHTLVRNEEEETSLI